MRRFLPALVALFTSATVAFAQNGLLPAPDPGCPQFGTHLISQTYPTRGLEPEFPIWCYDQPQSGAATALRGANSWVDTWDNDGPAISTLNDGDYSYRVFPRLLSRASNFRYGTFINSNHWMVDLVDVSADRLSGGILVSPDQTFSAQNGTLVVEADAAQGAPGMGGANHYYEIDVTSGTAPTSYTVDSLYGYGQFGFVGAVGCRFENPAIVCAMYDDSGRATDGRCTGQDANQTVKRPCTNGTGGFSGRVWETQGTGTRLTGASVQGGYPDWLIPGGGGLHVRDVMRQCGDNVHDLHCRDRLRMELTRTSLHLYANGYPIFLIDGLTASNSEGQDARIPQAFLDSGRFYMTSWINGGVHTPMRWHWNNVAVNPPYPASQAASESWCLGSNWTNPNGSISPNTCAHGHFVGCPELQPPDADCNAVGTVVPVQTPTPEPTQTPLPEATATSVPPTATPQPTPIPGEATATPEVPSCITVFVRLEDRPEQPVAFC